MADWSGAQYRRLSHLQDAVAADALGAAFGLLRGDDAAVLDVGCGDGRRSAEIADRVGRGRVLGIDASPRMINAARQLERPGLSFAELRVQDLDVTGEFDLVVSFNALHWIPRSELPGVLHTLRRALRAGGSALLQLVGAGEQTSLEDTAMQVAQQHPWHAAFADFPAPFTHPGPEEFSDWCRAAGFTVRTTDTRSHVWPFPSRSDFREWAQMGFGDWTGRLPDPQSGTDFVTDVVDTYCERAGTDAQFTFVQLRAVLDVPEAAGGSAAPEASALGH